MASRSSDIHGVDAKSIHEPEWQVYAGLKLDQGNREGLVDADGSDNQEREQRAGPRVLGLCASTLYGPSFHFAVAGSRYPPV
jgi:hypothetical protein